MKPPAADLAALGGENRRAPRGGVEVGKIMVVKTQISGRKCGYVVSSHYLSYSHPEEP